MIKGFTQLNKYLSELEEDRNELLIEVQGTANIQLDEMTKKNQDLKTQFSKERELKKESQDEVKME